MHSLIKKYEMGPNEKQAHARRIAIEVIQEEQRKRLDIARSKAVKWNVEQFRRALGPMVYIWWRTGDPRPLYIGRSINGLSRALNTGHHCSDVRDTATDLEFICCENDTDAALFEMELIRTLKPIFNKQLYGSPTKSMHQPGKRRSLTQILQKIRRNR